MAIYNSVFQTLEAHVHGIDPTMSMEPGNIANAIDKLAEAYITKYEFSYDDTAIGIRGNTIADKLDRLLDMFEVVLEDSYGVSDDDDDDEGGTDTPTT